MVLGQRTGVHARHRASGAVSRSVYGLAELGRHVLDQHQARRVLQAHRDDALLVDAAARTVDVADADPHRADAVAEAIEREAHPPPRALGDCLGDVAPGRHGDGRQPVVVEVDHGLLPGPAVARETKIGGRSYIDN